MKNRNARGAMLLGALVCMLPAVTQAQTWLPGREVVHAAIEAQPDVRAARARVDSAQAHARALQAGPHEVQVGVITQVRQSDDSDRTRRYFETEVQATRGLRWPNKARLDQRIGAAGISAAELRLDDAWHQSARRLLSGWLAYIRAGDRLRAANAQQALLQKEQSALSRRVQLGDAARKDLDLLQVELAQAETQRLAADAAVLVARDTLHSDFPSLPLPERPPTVEAPVPLDGAVPAWIQRIIERSHEIGALAADAEQADARAARARADRMPDPSLGLRTLHERGGRERGLGLVFSMPIGGRHRAALADAAGADANAAHGDVDAMRRDITRDAEIVVQNAATLRAQWLAQRRALDASATATQRVKRGWELGELALQDWLLAQRMHGQIALAEAQARADAEEARLRVLVDSHEIWHDE